MSHQPIQPGYRKEVVFVMLRLRSLARKAVFPLLLIILTVGLQPAAAVAESNGPTREAAGPQPLPHVSYVPFVAYNAAPPPACVPLFFDDFSDPSSGWPIRENNMELLEYKDHEYRMVAKEPSAILTASAGFAATEYAVSVTVRPTTVGDASAGLMFGRSEVPLQFYLFEVYQDAKYDIFYYNQGVWTELAKDDDPSPYINQGLSTNHLKVVRSGGSIEAYANGNLLKSLSNVVPVGARRVGLSASAYGTENHDVRFDNFTVYPLNCDGTASSSDAVNASDEGNSSVVHPVKVRSR